LAKATVSNLKYSTSRATTYVPTIGISLVDYGKAPKITQFTDIEAAFTEIFATINGISAPSI
jgi:hypothetical protein